MKKYKPYKMVAIPEINPKTIADIDSKYWPNGRIFQTDDGRIFEVLVSTCNGRIVNVRFCEIIFDK